MSRFSVKQAISSTLVSVLILAPIPSMVSAAANTDPATAALAGTKYLAANQTSTGSIGSNPGDTDWSIIAIQAAGQNAATFKTGSGASALDFMAADTLPSTAPATSVERRILAIAAAGQDTTQFGGVDYNTRLRSLYTANQIGSATLLNDDIFGLIAINATHDSTLKVMAQDSLNFLLAHQQADGGFSYTADTCALYCGSDSNDTAAAIIALGAAQDMSLTNAGLATAQTKALAYLLSTQQTDGGFGYDALSSSDGSSTSWGLMALNLVGPTAQAQAGSARTWLLKDQNTDGGFSYAAYGMTASDASTTAPSVLALLGTTWLLTPAPLKPAPTPTATPAPTPSAAVTPATTLNSAASSRSAAVTKVATSGIQPQADLIAAAAIPTAAPTGSVQGASQTKPTQVQDTAADSTPNLPLYGAISLLAIAAIWYVIQSILRKKV